LSISALRPIFRQHNLEIIDVEKLRSHGGSLRIFVVKTSSNRSANKSVQDVINEEAQYDPSDPEVYEAFRERAYEIKFNLLAELNSCKSNGKSIAAYGAAAKGVTLLNYCGIGSDLIDFVIDANPNKQGKFIPGVVIPIVDKKVLNENTPDILLILPWNLSEEIKIELADYLKSGLQIFRAIPSLEYF
jgi:hypothetical protein